VLGRRGLAECDFRCTRDNTKLLGISPVCSRFQATLTDTDVTKGLCGGGRCVTAGCSAPVPRRGYAGGEHQQLSVPSQRYGGLCGGGLLSPLCVDEVWRARAGAGKPLGWGGCRHPWLPVVVQRCPSSPILGSAVLTPLQAALKWLALLR